MNVKQERAYLKSNASQCPYCQSKQIHATGDDDIVSDTALSRVIKCNTCGKSWTDDYQLVGASGWNETD